LCERFCIVFGASSRGETEWREREKREGGMHGGREREERDEMRTKRREGGRG